MSGLPRVTLADDGHAQNLVEDQFQFVVTFKILVSKSSDCLFLICVLTTLLTSQMCLSMLSASAFFCLSFFLSIFLFLYF